MDWHRWMIGSLLVTTPLLGGCPGDDGGGDSAADSGTTASSGASTTLGASSQASSTSPGTGDGSGTGSTSTSTGTGTVGTETSADSSDSGITGGNVACGEGLECGPDEVCMMPCCGGPAPFCGPAEGPACPPGTHEVLDCGFGGECTPELPCCEDDPCVPDPPECVPIAEVFCEPSPNSPEIHCSSPCFGPLNEGVISCECA